MTCTRKVIDVDKAKDAYDKAVAASTRAGFLQDAALAAQLASRSLPTEAEIYFDRASTLQQRWGATGVVAQLFGEHQHGVSMIKCGPAGYKSRERFDGKVLEQHKNLRV